MNAKKIHNQKIYKLYEDIVGICIKNRCDIWKNSWMYNKQNKIEYYHLIWLESDGTLHYRDINDISIEIEYDKLSKRYRIDLRARYNVHNFWLFEDKDWINVEIYVKELITLQYNFIQKSTSLVNLTKDAYYDKEPKKMYKEMNIKQRIIKLKKLREL